MQILKHKIRNGRSKNSYGFSKFNHIDFLIYIYIYIQKKCYGIYKHIGSSTGVVQVNNGVLHVK